MQTSKATTRFLATGWGILNVPKQQVAARVVVTDWSLDLCNRSFNNHILSNHWSGNPVSPHDTWSLSPFDSRCPS